MSVCVLISHAVGKCCVHDCHVYSCKICVCAYMMITCGSCFFFKVENRLTVTVGMAVTRE